MPVTIELSEEQVSSIVLQALAAKQSVSVSSVKEVSMTVAQRIRQEVLKLPKGNVFSPTPFLQGLGINNETCGFSSAVKPLVNDKSLAMLQRGMWKRL